MGPNSLTKRLFGGWAILVLVFLYAPIVVVVVFAFNANRFVTQWTGFSTIWFSRALDNDVYISAVETSLKVAVLASIISTVIGTMAALALARMTKALRLPFDILVYLILVVPEIVIAVASLNFFVQVHANDPTGLFPGLGWITILLGQVPFDSALVMLIVRARFVGMGSTLEEASFDLGASPFSTFRQVTLPRLAPAIFAGLLMSFVFSFDDYVIPAFTSGSSTVTWPMAVFNSVRFGVTPALNALATIMLAITLGALLLTVLVLRRTRGDAKGDSDLTSALGLG